MAQDYARSVAKVLVAQIAESVGFDAIQQSANDTLSELLLQYIAEIGSATHNYAELAGRTDCNVNDLVRELYVRYFVQDDFCVWANSSLLLYC